MNLKNFLQFKKIFSFGLNKFKKIFFNLKKYFLWPHIKKHSEKSFCESKKHFFDIWSKNKFLWINKSFAHSKKKKKIFNIIKSISLGQRKFLWIIKPFFNSTKFSWTRRNRFDYIEYFFFLRIIKTFFNSKKYVLWPYIKEMFLCLKETLFSVFFWYRAKENIYLN